MQKLTQRVDHCAYIRANDLSYSLDQIVLWEILFDEINAAGVRF